MTLAQRSSPVPLYLQIEEDVRSRIRSGELPPMTQVLSEIELAEAFGVSRMTARKSIERLVGEGLLFRRPGKGTFVAPEKIAHRASTSLSFSAAMASLGLTVTTRVLDAGFAPAPRDVALALRQPANAEFAFVRRLRLVGGEPAAIHMAYLPARLRSILSQDLTESLNDLMTRDGARVSSARDTLEAVNASGDDAKLLGVRRGAALVRIEGVGLSAGQEPLRYTEALYRGDRFRFGVETVGDARELQVELKAHEAVAS